MNEAQGLELGAYRSLGGAHRGRGRGFTGHSKAYIRLMALASEPEEAWACSGIKPCWMYDVWTRFQ